MELDMQLQTLHVFTNSLSSAYLAIICVHMQLEPHLLGYKV